MIRPIRPISLMRLITKKLLLFSVALLVIGGSILYLTLINANKTQAAWFNDNWTYRKSVAISTHTAAENNVFISLTLDTATLITAGKMQSDCGDLRYTQYDGKLLKYYISNCNNISSTIHVFFPTFPAGAQTIYYYYGNPSASNGFESADFSTEAANYTVGSTGDEENSPGPSAYWTLDDASGVVAKNSVWKKTNSTTTNLITNPSFETNLTSWSFAGTGISHARSNEQAIIGSWSDKITWSSTADHYTEYNHSVSGSTTYTLSAYVYSSSTNGCFNYWEWNGSAGTASGTACPTVTNTWQRLNLTVTTRSDTVALLVRFYPGDSTSSGTAYVDGVQVEQASSATNYCDGSLVGNGSRRWTGTAHASTSVCDNGTDGFILNGSWQTSDQCVVGGCQKFNGTSTAIQNVTSVSGVKTVSMWVRPISVSSTALIDLNGTARITVSSGTISATGFTSPTIYVNGKVSSTLTANEWQLVTVTTGTAITASAIKIGNYSTTYFNGFIDEVKLYPNARSQAQILTDFSSRGSIKGAASDLGSNPQNNTGAFSQGLVGYWKMDEASGTTTVSDASGNSNTGTSTGTSASTNVTSGKFGNSRSFNGTDQYISATSIQPTNVTVAAWVNFGSSVTTNHAFIAAQSGEGASNIGSYFLRKDTSVGESGTFSFFIYNGSGYEPRVTATTIPSANTWYHVVGTFDGSNLKIYVNGVLENTRSRATSISYGTGNFLIGAQGSLTSNLFSGNIDETRIYNRALSSAEISALYNFAPGPRVYLKLDENTGTSSNDSSGNGRTGTINGNPIWAPGKYGAGLKMDGTGDDIQVSDF